MPSVSALDAGATATPSASSYAWTRPSPARGQVLEAGQRRGRVRTQDAATRESIDELTTVVAAPTR
jgi:hypothetical protein